jgi:hypothetical protein
VCALALACCSYCAAALYDSNSLARQLRTLCYTIINTTYYNMQDDVDDDDDVPEELEEVVEQLLCGLRDRYVCSISFMTLDSYCYATQSKAMEAQLVLLSVLVYS